ncbi:hypothetical protein [Nonomuraea sp. NPDC049709]|uniref:hypothetical protein n=1 Tax=Nonomuraea sp. NPDC049709 TaxID=3154736 RepID=UPI003440F026
MRRAPLILAAPLVTARGGAQLRADLEDPRIDQLTTRSLPRFGEPRGRVHRQLRRARGAL